jgi:hypothetical protein
MEISGLKSVTKIWIKNYYQLTGGDHVMNTQEATIEALQNRIKCLEAHLHLALQVLDEIENNSQDVITSLECQHQSQTIDIVPTSKIELPTFLHSRTWKHDYPDTVNYANSRDRLVAKAC